MSDPLASTPIVNDFFNNRFFYFLPLFVFTVVLAVFVDFVIITKSKTLGVFKHYILNQTIWIQLFEITIMLSEPIMLSPYMAGYSAGVFRYLADYKTITIINSFCFFLIECVTISILLTYLNRYLLTFHPQLQDYVEHRYTTYCLIVVYLLPGCYNVFFYFHASTDPEKTRKLASEESNHALDFYLNEPTFIYGSEANGATRKMSTIGFFILVLVSVFFVGSVFFFIRSVFIYKKMKGVISNKSKFMLTSTFVQVILLVVFIFVPYIWASFTEAFYVHNTVNITNAFLMLISMYGPVDMLCTLYFIVPYRKYCKSLLCCGKKQQNKVFVARPSNSTDIRRSSQSQV